MSRCIIIEDCIWALSAWAQLKGFSLILDGLLEIRQCERTPIFVFQRIAQDDSLNDTGNLARINDGSVASNGSIRASRWARFELEGAALGVLRMNFRKARMFCVARNEMSRSAEISPHSV